MASALTVTMVGIVTSRDLNVFSGGLYWVALVCLWRELSARSQRQMLWIVAASLPGLVVGVTSGTPHLWQRALSANSGMISMLIAVGFISLLPTATLQRPQAGLKGLLCTFANVHLVGAIINYSSVIIFGDRMARGRGLRLDQAMVLSRAFASAGFWSPFFATMAVALGYAPGAQFVVLLEAGMAMALLSLGVCIWDIKKAGGLAAFEGIGLSVRGMQLPALIGAIVLGAQWLTPAWTVLSTVTLVCPAMVCCLSFLRPGKLSSASVALVALVAHVRSEFPRHANELALFLAVGMFGVSLIPLLGLLPSTVVLANFRLVEASLGLSAVVVAALFGIHPLVSIAVLTRLVHTDSVNANVLGFVIVAGWAISSAVGPLSGQNLVIQGRYGVSSTALMRANLGYAVWMGIGAVGCIFFIL
ncbi:hypothetical protein [Paraburkholderia sp. BCC1886]|uniref:hypothetical protein n=1 Tax=Paraburkholderia sp. BCC1886 TaxID=2562670 RepID=UPI001182EDE7|nr:hypothetical protein [Paraburkholderia sp. BCC1886]